MSPERQAYFRGKLLVLQIDLQEDLSASKAASGVVELDTAIGRLSRMDAMQDQQMALELRRRQEQQLQRINNATVFAVNVKPPSLKSALNWHLIW